MKHLWTQKIPFLYGNNTARKERGYIALISVFIISAIIVLIATSASLLSISESDMSLQENQAWESFYLASFCVEQALMKLESVLNYEGNETLILGGKSCDILPLEGSGNFNRVIKAQSTASGQTRRIKVEISQVSPVMQITSWQQVAEF